MPVTQQGGPKVLTPEELKEITREKTPKENGEKKLRKTPVPQQYDRILAGALKLSLSQRVEMAKQIHDSIKSEVEQKKSEFEEAQKLVGQ